MTSIGSLEPHGFAAVQGGGNAVRALAAVGNAAATTAKTFGEVFVGGGGGALAATGSGGLGDMADFAQMIQTQMAVQKEQQVVTLQTNISKTEHESRMAVVRNLRP